MADSDMKAGDEVQHKTGKIKMIYIGDSTMGDAICEWTDPSGSPKRDSFSHSALKRYEAPPIAAGRIVRG